MIFARMVISARPVTIVLEDHVVAAFNSQQLVLLVLEVLMTTSRGGCAISRSARCTRLLLQPATRKLWPIAVQDLQDPAWDSRAICSHHVNNLPASMSAAEPAHTEQHAIAVHQHGRGMRT